MKRKAREGTISAEPEGRFISVVERDELLLAMALKIEDLESRIRRLEAATLGTSPHPPDCCPVPVNRDSDSAGSEH